MKYFTLTIGLISALSSLSQAQAETLYQRLIRDYQNDSVELGVRTGSMRLDPALTLDITQNSNIFATSSNEESDLIASLRPSLRLRNIEGPHLLQLIAGAELAKYSDFSDEDYNDATLAFNADWKLKGADALGMTLAYLSGHELRTSTEARNGIEPTSLDNLRAEMIYRGSNNRIGYGFELRHQNFDYDETVLVDNTRLSNDDRDHDNLYAAVNIGLSDEQRFSPYLRAGQLQQNYDAIDGLDRSSNSSFTHLGVRSNKRAVLSGDVYLGYAWNSFDDDRFDDFNDAVFGGNLSWWPTRLTNINANFSREMDGTTITGAAGTERTKVTLAANHELRRYMKLYIAAGKVSDDFVNLDRSDDEVYGMIELNRDLGRKFRIGAGISHAERSVSPENSDSEYSQNLFTISLRGRL